MRIGVSVGHYPESPGYKTGNLSEYSEMALLSGYLVHKLSRACHEAHLIGTGSLGKKISEINELELDAAIELHLNAGGGHGYETLYCPGSKRGKEFAAKVNSAVGLVLHSSNRGIKEGWYKMDKSNGPDAFLSKTNCPAIIFEMYFLDNATERATYSDALGTLDRVAERLTVGILSFLRGEK